MNTTTFPEQKLADNKKTPKWFTDCHNWLEQKLLYGTKYGVNNRQKLVDIRGFYEDGIISKEEIARIVNPGKLDMIDIPDGIRHHPLAKSYIRPLKGEELKRRFDWAVTVTSRDAISEKEEQKLQRVDGFIQESLAAKYKDEEQLGKAVEDFMDDSHSWQDLRESGMTELLTYYWERLNLKKIFSDAWDRELIEGKAIIDVDEYNNCPIVELLSPSCVYALKNQYDHFIENSDAVVIEQYLPVSVIKDRYYEYLTETHIKYLDERFNYGANNSNQWTPEAFYLKGVANNGTFFNQDASIDETIFNYPSFRGYFDGMGNVRVSRTRWIGERRVGFLNYFDENGVEQEIVVPDNYKPDPLKGERIRYKFVNEVYESTRIGDDIYIKQQVRNLQYRDLDNKSYCHIGIVGLEYDKSLFEEMKIYNVDYNAFMFKLEEAFAKTLGTIGVLDAAMIPEGWDVEKTMYYASKMGWLVVDSFKEGKKGKSQGKMAGEMSGQQKNIIIEQYQFIGQCFNKLQHIEMQMDKMFGINNQRRGLVEGDPGLGVAQEATQASLNATEWFFYNHDQLKLKVLRLLAENAKFCLRNGSETLQYVASDATIKMFTVDGPLLNEANYNTLLINSQLDAKTEAMLQEGIKIGFQSGQVNLMQMLDIYSNDSISSVRRKLTKSIKQNQRAQQEAKKAEMENDKQLQQMKNQDKDLDRQLKKYEIDQNNAVKIQTANIQVYARQQELDANMNGIPDPAEIAANALEQQRMSQEKFTKDKEHILKDKEINEKIKLEKTKIETQKQNEREKTRQIEVQNKNQELLQKRELEDREKDRRNKILLEKIKAKSKSKTSKK